MWERQEANVTVVTRVGVGACQTRWVNDSAWMALVIRRVEVDLVGNASCAYRCNCACRAVGHERRVAYTQEVRYWIDHVARLAQVAGCIVSAVETMGHCTYACETCS